METGRIPTGARQGNLARSQAVRENRIARNERINAAGRSGPYAERIAANLARSEAVKAHRANR
jgi:hypothetical protein